jgi:hypothetical protein
MRLVCGCRFGLPSYFSDGNGLEISNDLSGF